MNQASELSDDKRTPSSVSLKPASWMLQLDTINHLLVFNNVVLTVLAGYQGGKSTFARFLADNLSHSFDTFLTTIAIPYEEYKLAASLAGHLKLSKPTSVSLSDICHQVNERHHHTLVILDNAHYLPEKAIAEIVTIIQSQSDAPYFHMILISDHSVLPCLKALSRLGSQAAIHSLEIGQFAPNEIKTLLSQRLTDEQFRSFVSEEALSKFYQATNGEISRMNYDMSQFFCLQKSSAHHQLSIKKRFFAVAAMIVVSFISIYIGMKENILTSIHPLASLQVKEQGLSLQSQIAHLTFDSDPSDSSSPSTSKTVVNEMVPSQLPDGYINAHSSIRSIGDG